MIVGSIRYEDKDCIFKLYEEEFVLEIEVVSDRQESTFRDLELLLKQPSDKITHDIELSGTDFDTQNKIRFSVHTLNQQRTNTYTASLKSYLILQSAETSFDGITFKAKDLDLFHNVGEAYKDMEFDRGGKAKIELTDFTKTTKEFNFTLNETIMHGTLGISRKINSFSTTPIELSTALNYHFPETSELDYIEELVLLTKKVLQFVTYRKDSQITQIHLKKMDKKDGKYKNAGQLFVHQRESFDDGEKDLTNKRIIPYSLLESTFPTLLSKLAANQIYLRHIPKSRTEGKTITSEKYIMLTAGFEWQFASLYPTKNKKKNRVHIEQKKEILDFLNEKIDNSTGKNKKYYKYHKKLIDNDDYSLHEKIELALLDFDEILNPFIVRLYKLNKVSTQKYVYKEIAERIRSNRNNVAHGNIIKDMDQYSILDFIVLEWLCHSMALREIGMQSKNIQKSINKLFNRGFAL